MLLAIAMIIATTLVTVAVQPAAATRAPIVVESTQWDAWGRITVSFTQVGGYEKVQVYYEWDGRNANNWSCQQITLKLQYQDGSYELNGV